MKVQHLTVHLPFVGQGLNSHLSLWLSEGLAPGWSLPDAFHAVVIGDDIGSLACAISLRRNGNHVTVLERAPEILEVMIRPMQTLTVSLD